MGRSTTPTYVVKLHVRGYALTEMAWHCKDSGRPSDKTLRNYVAMFEASTQEGEANAHLGRTHVVSAYVRRQSTGEYAARYTAPAV